jgi:hypothetical protein
MPKPERHAITAIALTLKRPDGTTYSHTIDPKECDALAWSDRAVEVLGKFYDKNGPAEGKHMSREDFLQHFPHGTPLIGDQTHLPLTSQVVNQIWNHPKEDGTAPAFLCKSLSNIVNGK